MVTGVARTRPAILKELLPATAEAEVAASELMAKCPKCKTFETLTFTLDGTIRTLKFSQQNNQVYHDCGSTEPCQDLWNLRLRDAGGMPKCQKYP